MIGDVGVKQRIDGLLFPGWILDDLSTGPIKESEKAFVNKVTARSRWQSGHEREVGDGPPGCPQPRSPSSHEGARSGGQSGARTRGRGRSPGLSAAPSAFVLRGLEAAGNPGQEREVGDGPPGCPQPRAPSSHEGARSGRQSGARTRGRGRSPGLSAAPSAFVSRGRSKRPAVRGANERSGTVPRAVRSPERLRLTRALEAAGSPGRERKRSGTV